jgi:hypothetical protein
MIYKKKKIWFFQSSFFIKKNTSETKGFRGEAKESN